MPDWRGSHGVDRGDRVVENASERAQAESIIILPSLIPLQGTILTQWLTLPQKMDGAGKHALRCQMRPPPIRYNQTKPLRFLSSSSFTHGSGPSLAMCFRLVSASRRLIAVIVRHPARWLYRALAPNVPADRSIENADLRAGFLRNAAGACSELRSAGREDRCKIGCFPAFRRAASVSVG